MKISKRIYLHSFTFIVVILALYRCGHDAYYASQSPAPVDTLLLDSLLQDSLEKESIIEKPASPQPSPEEGGGANTQETPQKQSEPLNVLPPIREEGQGGRLRVYTRKYAVNNFQKEFPDSNSVQLVVAQKYGVKIVQNRQEAEKRKSELVYVGANPYFFVDKLHESIPYLVPRANTLLQDIGRAFYDSLYAKGVPLHKIIITSALRTEEDVARLRKHNGNASENSCHRFGTTFDICQNRYKTVQTKAQPRRQVTNDTLKWILSEVLRDKRNEGRCYIKYEVHQGCFHVTTR